ncbi:MAG: hypothetical protein WBF35_00155 [Candidatus Acidiferrales bacterium]
MRIWGNIVLIVGILFLLLFGLAEFGGGHLGVVPFFVAGLLIFMGAKLRASGKGIVQANPAESEGHLGSAVATALSQPAAPAAQFSTVELPLTPEVAALIAAQSARGQRLLLYVVAGFLVFFVVLGVVLDVVNAAPGQGQTLALLLGGIGVAAGVMIYGISWLTTRKPVRRDLRGTTYLRTTGPVKVVPISTGAMLRLADRAFLIDRRYGMAQLSTLGWGTVDYSPHGHVILGAWDNQGRPVYCLPGYAAGIGVGLG